MSRLVIAYRYYPPWVRLAYTDSEQASSGSRVTCPSFSPTNLMYTASRRRISRSGARPADAPTIARIDAQRSGTNAKHILPMVRGELEAVAAGESPKVVFVACQGEQVLAFAKCVEFGSQFSGVDHDLPQGWYLSGVTVEESHRRQGLGRKLTAHRLDWIRERADTAYYFASALNQTSIALHAALGFHELRRNITVPSVSFTGGVGAAVRV